MNNIVMVRVGHRFAHLPKKLQAFGDTQFLLIAIAIKRLPLNVFHDKIRQAIRGRAAIQQARNEGMIERRENLPFLAKAT
jgi:hypothetical protein